MSTHIAETAIFLRLLPAADSFLVLAQGGFHLMDYRERSLTARRVAVRGLTCCVALGMGSHLAQKLLVVTGHDTGQVVAWTEDFQETIMQGNSEITCMEAGESLIYVGDRSAEIYVMQVDPGADTLRMKIKMASQMNLTTFPFKLFSYEIVQLQEARERLFVTTYEGDYLEVTLGSVPSANKYLEMFKLPESNKVMSLFEYGEDNLIIYVGGNSKTIVGIDTKTHQLVDVWLIGH